MGGIRDEIVEAREEVKQYTMWNYTELLKIYADEMQAICNSEGGGLESSIPLTSKYFKIRNKYQFAVNFFKPK